MVITRMLILSLVLLSLHSGLMPHLIVPIPQVSSHAWHSQLCTALGGELASVNETSALRFTLSVK